MGISLIVIHEVTYFKNISTSNVLSASQDPRNVNISAVNGSTYVGASIAITLQTSQWILELEQVYRVKGCYS